MKLIMAGETERTPVLKFTEKREKCETEIAVILFYFFFYILLLATVFFFVLVLLYNVYY